MSDLAALYERILVCGGRDFNAKRRVFEVLDALQPHPMLVIHGNARGADTLAGEWARERNILEASFPADWAKHGRAAGVIRNRQMLDEGRPTFVVAFPGGHGTANMVRIAKAAGVSVLEVSP